MTIFHHSVRLGREARLLAQNLNVSPENPGMQNALDRRAQTQPESMQPHRAEEIDKSLNAGTNRNLALSARALRARYVGDAAKRASDEAGQVARTDTFTQDVARGAKMERELLAKRNQDFEETRKNNEAADLTINLATAGPASLVMNNETPAAPRTGPQVVLPSARVDAGTRTNASVAEQGQQQARRAQSVDESQQGGLMTT